jgi:ribose transport system permease protein
MADLTLPLRGLSWRRIPGVAYMLAVLAASFAAISNGFVDGANLANVGMQSMILLLLALPMTLIMMTEGIDLSMGAVLTLASIVLAVVAVKTGSVSLALAGALGLGAAFGLANGALVAWLKLPPFVTTLGTMGIASGLALVITDAQSITGVGDNVVFFYAGTLAGFPMPLLVGVAAYLCTHWLLYHTRFGTYVFALGGNREALRLAGVRANAYLIGVYIFGGAMAGLAALLLTARMSAAHPTAAIGMEFDAIAAVAIGGTSFEKGDGWLFGTLLGVMLVGVLRNGLNLLAVPSSIQVVAVGVLIIAALLIESLKGRA